MSEPVTIGEQTFVNDPDKGWIDRKTKLPADKGLIKLLDSLELKPVEPRLKIKIDKTREPVFLNGQKFIYDKNSGWIDEKTKIRIPDNLQKILESATKPAIEEMAAATEQVAESFGAVGSAAKQRVRTKNPPKVTSKKQATANRIANNKSQLAINTQFVKMITHLSSINGLFQQKKEQDIATARNVSDQLDEAKIENAAQNDTPTAPDATKEKGPDLFLLAAGGLLIANYIDPILNVVTTLSEGIYKVGSFTMDVVKAINSAFTFVSGGNKPEQTPAVTTSSAVTQSQKPETETKPDAVSQPMAPVATPTAQTEAAAARPQSKNEAPSSPRGGVSKPAKTPAPSGSMATSAPKSATPPAAAAPSTSSPAKQTSAPTWTASPGFDAGKLSNNPAVRDKAFAADATKQSSGNINPSDVLAFTGRSGDQSHFNILEPETKEAILSAAAEYKQTTGKKLTINSSRRTNQEQQILWNNRASNPNPVAPPGTSNHEKGWAVDIGQRDDPTAKSILEKHGMMWYGSNDPVHYTLKGHGEGGGGGGIGGAIAGAVDQGKEALGDIIKGFARIVNGKSKPLEGGIAGIAQRNKSSYAVNSEKMDAAQSERHADVIEATNPAPEPRQTTASLPNLNAGNPSLGIKTPVTSDDKRIVYDYLRYFKVIPQDTTGPALVLAK